MDRVNAQVVAVLQARARLALRIAREKERHGHPAPDPAREREMLRAMLAGAPEGFPRADLAPILRAILAASRRLVVRDRAGGRGQEDAGGPSEDDS